jgi:hypothetical protein
MMSDWTLGLRTGIRNSLKGHGFRCREDVVSAFVNGEIHFNNPGGGCSVYGLGRKGIVELREWLGLPAQVKKNGLELAIKICEQNGYTVTKKE